MRHIHLLTLLNELSSLRAAADALHLTQPAVSKMLREIEQAFGVVLFERSRRGVAPNAFGRSVIHRAHVIRNELSHSIDEVQAALLGTSAIIRLGTMSITSIVPAATVDLMQRMPGARIQIREGPIHSLLELLLDAKLDCVFGAVPSEALNRNFLELVRAETIFEDHICAVLSEANPLFKKRKLRWSEMADQKWVLPPPESPIRQAFMTGFMKHGLAPPQPAIETLSPVTLGMLLRLDSSLVGLVRYESVRQEDAFPGARAVTIEPKVDLPSFCVLTRRTAVRSSEVVQEFIECLRRAARPGAMRRSAPSGEKSRRTKSA
ncbi:MAG: LysR substrate-binding domain-containing protein [Rhodoblastus sp.]